MLFFGFYVSVDVCVEGGWGSDVIFPSSKWCLYFQCFLLLKCSDIGTVNNAAAKFCSFLLLLKKWSKRRKGAVNGVHLKKCFYHTKLAFLMKVGGGRRKRGDHFLNVCHRSVQGQATILCANILKAFCLFWKFVYVFCLSFKVLFLMFLNWLRNSLASLCAISDEMRPRFAIHDTGRRFPVLDQWPTNCLTSSGDVCVCMSVCSKPQ